VSEAVSVEVTDSAFETLTTIPLESIGEMIKAGDEPVGTQVPKHEPENTTAHGIEKPPINLHLVPDTQSIQPEGRLNVLQQYEGVVLSIDRETFWARLNNKTSHEADEEEGEFSLEEVSKDDRWLVKPGSIFYWYIGYYDSASGQRTRQSIIRFRRLPAFTPEDLIRARDKAKKLMDMFLKTEKDDAIGGE